ncbi:MAG: hypothetical protein M3Y64_08565, partial [Gemmatimonadota bacterium]|nr:hypothetical protein [Gemmatimonadota bacterium]
GVPVAIEQDLYWRHNRGNSYVPVVAHDSDALATAPTFEAYFFDRIRPTMERALVENRRKLWPLIVLNLDFKTNERAHHQAITALLRKYDRWLTTAPRTATPEIAMPFTVGPLLVLNGADTTQRRDFHDAIAIGDKLRTFGAIPVPAAHGETREERAHDLVQMSAADLIRKRRTNYERWVNFPWGAVEEGGQTRAGDFTSDDSVRLSSLVYRAHDIGLWIRFYTLDGFVPSEDMGFTASYNFGSRAAVVERWRAVTRARVDFVATDQYAEFAEQRRLWHR